VEKVVMEESITTATWVSIVPPKECLAMPSAAGNEVKIFHVISRREELTYIAYGE